MKKRFSKKRQAILDCLHSTQSHPTADWVFLQLKPHFPDLSLATVYRNLSEMKAEGVIRSVGIYHDREHFDGRADAHVHLVCQQCGSVFDAPDAPLPTGWAAEIASVTGFAPADAHIFGKCRACIQAAEQIAPLLLQEEHTHPNDKQKQKAI